MSNNSTWTDDMIRDAVGSATQAEKKQESEKAPAKRRNLLVVGCGDGGSTIAAEIRKSIPETYAICYNTSSTAVKNLVVDQTIITQSSDGSGKVRAYSKDMFKKESYKLLLGKVNTALEERRFDYIIVVSTTDGGTGSGVSPMVSQLLSQNTKVPVILIGVYPNLTEDATAQYNAMMWQSEVSKIKIPYMIFDNNIRNKSKTEIHQMVNTRIAEVLKVLTGDYYGSSNITMIDTRDLFMLIKNGGRIVINTEASKMKVDQSLDDFLIGAINTDYQPVPDNCTAIGVFVKGPKSLIKNVDTSLTNLKKSFGDPTVQYTHLEESEDIQISIILSGCSEAEDVLYQIRGRYDDIMAAQKEKESIMSDLVSDLVSPISGTDDLMEPDNGPDLSALDL